MNNYREVIVMGDSYPVSEEKDKKQGFFGKLFNKKRDDEGDVTEEGIIDMVNEGQELGVLEENEAEMITIYLNSETRMHSMCVLTGRALLPLMQMKASNQHLTS